MANRKIIAYKHYFEDFINSVDADVRRKVSYIFDILKTQERIPPRFVKLIIDGLYELRIEYYGNIYRVFFEFDNGNIIVLFNGFQKKSQKTPKNELEKAIEIKKEYDKTKRNK